MTVFLTTVGYQLVAVGYAVFSGIVVSRGARSRLSFFFFLALAATALWAQFFVFANYQLVPDLVVDLTGVLRDGAWLAFSLALIFPLSGRRSYWLAVTGISAAL